MHEPPTIHSFMSRYLYQVLSGSTDPFLYCLVWFKPGSRAEHRQLGRNDGRRQLPRCRDSRGYERSWRWFGELASVEVVGDGHTQQRSENNVDKVVSVVLSSTQCNIDGQKKGEESKQQLGGLAPISLVGVDLSVYPQAEERHSHKSCGGVARRSGFHALQNGVHISSANLDCHILINGSSLGGLTSGNEVGSVSAHVNLEKVGDEAVEEGGNQKGGQSDGHELESVLRSGAMIADSPMSTKKGMMMV